MAWNPCDDKNLNIINDSEIWRCLQSIYDTAYPTVSLPRASENSMRLANDYIIERQGVACHAINTSILPISIRNFRLGYFEVDMLDWLFNCFSDRMLYLVGPRGAGKSTFLHYIEYVVNSSTDMNMPLVLFVDLLDSDKDEDGYDTKKRIIRSLYREIKSKNIILKKNQNDNFRNSICKVAEKFSNEDCFDNISEFLLEIKQSYSWQDSRSIVIFFDNLDHLNFKAVTICIKLMKDFWSYAQIGSVLSIRPSIYNSITANNTARAYIPGYIRITPPTLEAWLKHFPERMARAHECLSRINCHRELDSVPLTAKRVYDVSERIAILLNNTTTKDNSSRFMEALSSHDMRHFNGLMRRLLQNHDLPMNWLLRKVTTDDTPNFYPMFAIMQGERRWFTRNDYVPNLLTATCKHNRSDFLLFHRILSLLARKTPPMSISDIFQTMEEYGYHQSDVVQSLEYLRRVNVIYGSDLESSWSDNNLPEYCGLTESGIYCLNFLFSDSDYLVSVVLDVPLNHKYLQSHLAEQSFSPQIHSLYEYLIEVKDEENRQFSAMRRRPPSSHLALAADRLRHGNTCFGKILYGFQEIVSRGIASSAYSVKSVCKKYEEELTVLHDALRSLEQALEDILNRAQKRQDILLPPREEKDGIDITYHQEGTELNAAVTVRYICKSSTVILCAWRSDGNGRYPCIQLSPKETTNGEMEGIIMGLPYENNKKIIESAIAYSIDFPAQKNHYSNYPATIDITINIEKINITLTIFRHDVSERYSFHPDITRKELVEWSKKYLLTIQQRACDGSLQIEIIRGFGHRLSEKIFSAKEISQLRSIFLQIDSCWLLTDIPEVPWEWITIDSDEEMKQLLCEHWNIKRTHMVQKENHIPFYHSNFAKSSQRTLRTIGLEKTEDQQWRSKKPSSPKEVLELIDKSGFVHLVAHAKNPGVLEFDEEAKWNLTPHDVNGYIPRKKESHMELIISSCKCGISEEENMAIEFASRFNCPAWAPLIDIDENSVDHFDLSIKNMIYEEKDTADGYSIFKKLRNSMPFLYLYVCYFYPKKNGGLL